MSVGEMAFLGLVIGALLTFMGTVGFISIWSRSPRSLPAVKEPTVPAVDVTADFRKAA